MFCIDGWAISPGVLSVVANNVTLCLPQEVGMMSLPLLETSMTAHSCFQGALCTEVHSGVDHPLKGKQRLLLVGVVPLYKNICSMVFRHVRRHETQ